MPNHLCPVHLAPPADFGAVLFPLDRARGNLELPIVEEISIDVRCRRMPPCRVSREVGDVRDALGGDEGAIRDLARITELVLGKDVLPDHLAA